MRKQKHEVLTFKADASLLDAMRGIRNRSDFIRNAIQAALDSTCPLCMGTGILTPNQKTHWDSFAKDHAVAECDDCNELILICAKRPKQRRPTTKPHAKRQG